MAEKEKLNVKGYVKGCLLQPRAGETLFHGDGQGIRPTLKGYAVIPVEEYERLTREEMPATKAD